MAVVVGMLNAAIAARTASSAVPKAVASSAFVGKSSTLVCDDRLEIVVFMFVPTIKPAVPGP